MEERFRRVREGCPQEQRRRHGEHIPWLKVSEAGQRDGLFAVGDEGVRAGGCVAAGEHVTQIMPGRSQSTVVAHKADFDEQGSGGEGDGPVELA